MAQQTISKGDVCVCLGAGGGRKTYPATWRSDSRQRVWISIILPTSVCQEASKINTLGAKPHEQTYLQFETNQATRWPTSPLLYLLWGRIRPQASWSQLKGNEKGHQTCTCDYDVPTWGKCAIYTSANSVEETEFSPLHLDASLSWTRSLHWPSPQSRVQ